MFSIVSLNAKFFLNTNLTNLTNNLSTEIIRVIREIRVRLLHHHGFAGCTEEGSDNVTETTANRRSIQLGMRQKTNFSLLFYPSSPYTGG
jgi:hypothetical protein